MDVRIPSAQSVWPVVASLLPFGPSSANNAQRNFRWMWCLFRSRERRDHITPLEGTNAAMFRTDIHWDDLTKVLTAYYRNIIVYRNAQPQADPRHCNVDVVIIQDIRWTVILEIKIMSEKLCRGIQMTDVNGEVEFTTIFPDGIRAKSVIFISRFRNSVATSSAHTYPLTKKSHLYLLATLHNLGADPLNF